MFDDRNVSARCRTMMMRVRVSRRGIALHRQSRQQHRVQRPSSDDDSADNSEGRYIVRASNALPMTLSARIGLTPSKIGRTCASAT